MPETAAVNAGDGITVVIDDETDNVTVDPVTGAVSTETPDGSVVVQFAPQGGFGPAQEEPLSEFYANLVDRVEGGARGLIVDDLLQAIEADDRSRAKSLSNYARGLDLLGLELEDPKASVGESSSGQDGLSTVTNPLLIENCLRGWATAVGELLPAEGPAKVENISSVQTAEDDNLADSFERDINHYLMVLCPEYVPDTSGMLLWGTYFAGAGFKKIYRCPIRRRPVSDSVDRRHLIVSDTTKDLGACERITHEIPMRSSVLKRLQMNGHYADVPLAQPSPSTNVVDDKIGAIQGTDARRDTRPEDQPYTIYETQCELLLPEFYSGAAKKFADKHVPLPFLVTIEKDTRTILAIRRDWKPEDEECKRKKMYVKYPYVPGPGFYGTGLLNILGNASAALTAAWREALDAGMFASFPGGVVSKLGTRQNSSVLRPAPGEFVPVETNGMKIGDTITGLPYKDVTPGLMALIDKITTQAKAAGTAAEVPIGEGVQNVPVGTMLAYIEQATKIMSAAHKGMHTAQGEELQLIVDLFREDPEAFWRGNKICPERYWNETKLFAALDNCNLVPRSDPNVPSHVHRLMKAVALSQLLKEPAFASELDASKILDMILSAIQVSPISVRKPPPSPDAPPPPPSPESITAAAKMKEADVKQQAEATKAMRVRADLVKEAHDSEQQRQEVAGQMKLKSIDLAKELIIHGSEQRNADRQHVMDANRLALDIGQAAHQASLDTYQTLNPKEPTGGK